MPENGKLIDVFLRSRCIKRSSSGYHGQPRTPQRSSRTQAQPRIVAHFWFAFLVHNTTKSWNKFCFHLCLTQYMFLCRLLWVSERVGVIAFLCAVSSQLNLRSSRIIYSVVYCWLVISTRVYGILVYSLLHKVLVVCQVHLFSCRMHPTVFRLTGDCAVLWKGI